MNNPRAPLLPGISQYEVDFVIPRIGIDLPLGIDPFLLFKSRDPELRRLHQLVLEAFNAGIEAIRHGSSGEARQLLDFPEVNAIGFGYSRDAKRGSGVGSYLAGLIIETLKGSPGLQERGIKHIEEMQLVSAGIGADRISDIAANILKKFFVDYTQRQCALWKIPLQSGVPVSHIYSPASYSWEDSYEDLPVSPINGMPILLVPRRIVRALPWINYDDFLRTEFTAYLEARRASARRAGRRGNANLQTDPAPQTSGKTEVITVTRSDIGLIDRYVRSREQRSNEAVPAFDYLDEDACREATALKEKLKAISPGREQAEEYQKLILEILNFLFSPELIDGIPEVRTRDGTERRDIIFTNDSDESFWDYVRTTHDGIFLMFEAKNTQTLELAAINQTATYLGDRIGRLGVIVTREAPPETIQRKAFAVWNDQRQGRSF
jgi:hypothetical protein